MALRSQSLVLENQILVHISNTPEELIQYNQEKSILVEAYSSFGYGELFKNQEVAAIAEKYKPKNNQGSQIEKNDPGRK